MADREREDPVLERRRAVLIGLALLCCYGYFFYLGGNWNVQSRNAQIYALAEQGSLVIDEYPGLPEDGGDAAKYNGHYYSDKLIGPSLVAVPVYWAARRALSAAGVDFRPAVYVALRITNFFVNAVPSALLAALLYLFLAELGLSSGLRAWVTLAYGLGTLALPYSTALFGHQFAAVCVGGAFMLLWRQRQGWSAARGAAAGALAGLGAISDFMALVIAFFLGLYVVWLAVGRAGRETRRVAVFALIPAAGAVGAGALADLGAISDLMALVTTFFLGLYVVWLAVGRAGIEAARARRETGRVAVFAVVAGLVLCVQLGTNWASFGGPFELAQAHHATLGAHHEAGFLGIGKPKLEALYQLTFGPYRGLFFGSPVLLLALPGLFLLGRKMRAEAIIIGAAWATVLVINSGYADWPAGTAYGPRYQIAAIPLLMIGAGEVARRAPFMFKALTVISIVVMVIVCAQNPFWIPVDVRNPLGAALGGFAAGDLEHANVGMLIGLTGIVSLLPLVVVEAGLLYGLRLVRTRKQ